MPLKSMMNNIMCMCNCMTIPAAACIMRSFEFRM